MSLFLINKNLTKEIFFNRTGSLSGYSLYTFSRMYDSLTSELISVDREYEEYYSFEYESLEQFLYKKYNLREKDIEVLLEERKKNPDCILYRKDDNSYGDYGLSQFSYSDPMYERIMNILTLKTHQDEN